MSDIHGCLAEFEERLVQLEGLGFFAEGCTDQLVLLGDYIDRGPHSLGVVREAMRLERECPGRVFALAGNHEDEFLRWLGEGAPASDWDDDALLDDGLSGLLAELEPDFGPPSGHAALDRLRMWRMVDADGATMRSLLGAEAYAEQVDELVLDDGVAAAAFERACARIRSRCAAEVRWMRGLHELRETSTHVFVHAGIREELGERWWSGTTRDYMLNARDRSRGAFHKAVVAGHTPAPVICNDYSLRGVLWDGGSHYHIDGMAVVTRFIPVLVYDSETATHRELDEHGALREIRRWDGIESNPIIF